VKDEIIFSEIYSFFFNFFICCNRLKRKEKEERGSTYSSPKSHEVSGLLGSQGYAYYEK
jgi:hypothetical protein